MGERAVHPDLGDEPRQGDKAICDAGLKAQSVDSGLPVIFGRDDVKYVKCSDEHGVIEDPEGVLKVGDKLRLVPGHCDPTCNVHDWYVACAAARSRRLAGVGARQGLLSGGLILSTNTDAGGSMPAGVPGILSDMEGGAAMCIVPEREIAG